MAGRCRQRSFVFRTRGGKRKGAGRKRAGRKRVAHIRRRDLRSTQPVHVTLRLCDDVGSVRNRRGFALVRLVMLRVAERNEEFRIVHLSIQGNHLHLICEASNRTALRAGIAAFKISFAKRLNKQRGRSGQVWSDRYHDEILVTPSQVRNAIGYCLGNWRKHGFDRGCRLALDPYSTARHFPGWKEWSVMEAVPRADDEILPRTEPRSWLLRDGYQRGGPPLSALRAPALRQRNRNSVESVPRYS